MVGTTCDFINSFTFSTVKLSLRSDVHRAKSYHIISQIRTIRDEQQLKNSAYSLIYTRGHLEFRLFVIKKNETLNKAEKAQTRSIYGNSRVFKNWILTIPSHEFTAHHPCGFQPWYGPGANSKRFTYNESIFTTDFYYLNSSCLFHLNGLVSKQTDYYTNTCLQRRKQKKWFWIVANCGI